jgi:hypothetical protein
MLFKCLINVHIHALLITVYCSAALIGGSALIWYMYKRRAQESEGN